MSMFNIREAKTNFSKLVKRAENGEEVIISRAGKPVALIVPYTEQSNDNIRLGGQWKGKIHVSKDFDLLPADISTAFGT